MIEAQSAFWDENPALRLGISALLGALLFFQGSIWPASLWMIYLFFLMRFRFWPHILIISFVAIYSFLLFSHLPKNENGRAVFAIHSVQPYSSPFQNGYRYQGTIQSFESKSEKLALSLPCSVIYMGNPEERPKANCDYIIEGKLRKTGDYAFSFKVKSWERIAHTWSLAEWRHLAKSKIRSILKSHLHEPHTDAFLAALFTGDIENRMLRFEFSRLGLQYLLVISGFHFAILAAFVAFFARQMFSSRLHLWVLLSAISIYYLFVGNSAPVQRSFIAAAIFLIGELLQKKASGLNVLGGCLFIEVILDPVQVLNIGFQLSFLSCFGIFLLFDPIRKCFSSLFPIRSWHATLELPHLDQCVSIFSTFFSRAIFLTLSVNLALWPLLLYHFHRFPFLSLFYNLFAPALTAVALFLLLAALTAYALFPLFSLPLFKMADFVTANLLEIIGHPPAMLDYGISTSIPGWIVGTHIVILFLAARYMQYQKEKLAIPCILKD